MAKKIDVVKVVTDIVKPIIEKLELTLWDVKFEKEGASWYLRIFIDKEGGITIDDCENVSRSVNDLIDQADPIEQSYFLEVCSPGINRRLDKKEHMMMYIGSEIDVKLYKAVNGTKDFRGTLTNVGQDDFMIMLDEETSMTITFKEAAAVKLFETDFS